MPDKSNAAFEIIFDKDAQKMVVVAKQAMDETGVDYEVVSQEWLGSGRERARVAFLTNSYANAKCLRDALREHGTLTTLGLKGSSGKFYYHESPYQSASKAVKVRSDIKDAILKAADEYGYSPLMAKRTINLIIWHDLIDNWKLIDASELLKLDGFGHKTVKLLILARGGDPSVLDKPDRTILDISPKFSEALRENESISEKFENLRLSVMKGSHHPESLGPLLDMAFDLGCKCVSRQDVL